MKNEIGKHPRTLLVGLDGACWEYLESLLERGRLPHIHSLVDQGCSGRLRSTLPAWTPTAWASLITGKNPGKHGVFDMLWRSPGSYHFSPTNSRMRMGTPFWTRLNAAGVRVGLVNVPFTHPTDPLDGFVVHGFGAPESASELAYPAEAEAWVSQHRDAGPRAPQLAATPSQRFFYEREEQRLQVEAALELAGRFRVEVLAINLMHFDHANHNQPDLGRVEESLEQTDRDIGRLIDEYQPDNIMLISDHGSRRVKGGFRLNVWLRDHGYCVPLERTPRERRQALNWALALYSRTRSKNGGPAEKLTRRLIVELASRLSMDTSRALLSRLESVVPSPRDYLRWSEKLDYGKSRFFLGSTHSGLLYLNQEGREPNGRVAESRRASELTELQQKLMEIVDPVEGGRIFSNVFLGSEIYQGPALEHGPDLVLDAYDSSYGSLEVAHGFHPGASVRGRYFVENHRGFGDHSREGLFAFSGPAFALGLRECEAHVMDVPATLLQLYQVPIPSDWDGRVLGELFHPEAPLRRTPVEQPGDPVQTTTAGAYSSDESQQIVDRLRSLGYL